MEKPKLTTYDEILASYRTTIVKTSTGNVFEIKMLSPGDFVLSVGTPIVKKLTELGIDISKAENLASMGKELSSLPLEKKLELVSHPSFLDTVRKIVAKGVISLNFVLKPQSECSKEQEEVSIDRLRLEDLMELQSGIVELSLPGAVATDAIFFRGDSEEKQGSDAVDTSDGEDIQPEAGADAISPLQES